VGQSPSVASLAQTDKEFRDYLDGLKKDVDKETTEARQDLDKMIDNHYKTGGWDDRKPFVQGMNVDVQHMREWSLDNVKKILDATKSALFGKTDLPKDSGVKVNKEDPAFEPAIKAMASFELYIASKAFEAIGGILETFAMKTGVTIKKDVRKEAVAPGWTLFLSLREYNYQSQKFFNNETISQYFYLYDVQYSVKEGKSLSKMSDHLAYENLKTGWRTRIDNLSETIANPATSFEAVQKLVTELEYYEKQLEAATKKYEELERERVTALIHNTRAIVKARAIAGR
jgi:hypothetical protein